MDIDELNLFTKLKIVREIIQVENYALIDILNYIKRINSFLNVFIVYRIITTLVSVASVERNFQN